MKRILLSSAVILSMTLFSCSNSGETKTEDGAAPADTSKGVSAMSHDSLSTDQAAMVYVCPCGGCPEIKESKPGKCSKCQLDLVEQKK